MIPVFRWSRRLGYPLATALLLAAGGVLAIGGAPGIAATVWRTGLWLLGIPLVFRTIKGVTRGRFAADLVAALAVVTSLLLNHPFAGLVIVLMQTGGEALERLAEGRASAAVRALEADAPSIAHRLFEGRVTDHPAAEIAVGERVLVRPGEMVPCDGIVETGTADVDASRLTGEPLPIAVTPGTRLRSGALVVNGPLVLTVTARSSESLYASIVELVRSAQASKAPLQRVADRSAVWFTPLTLVVAGLAYLLSGEPDRALAVLVVATPCPLILAAPVAFLGGINRAARRLIIVRHGGALEALATVDTALFDKTGTLTQGRPAVSEVRAIAPFDATALLRLAGAVEEGSGHLLARTLVAEARRGGISLPAASVVRESPGRGVTGRVEGREVTVGALSLIEESAPGAAPALRALHGEAPGLRAYITVDGQPAGVVSYADGIRREAGRALADLRGLGVTHFSLLSGDHARNASEVARALGIEEVAGDLLPSDKVAHVARLTTAGHRVLMVGDGTNDAPALSSSAVGLALAAHGGGIVAEAADVVVLADDLGRVPEAVAIGRRTLRIARQSIGAGLGLSAIAMLVAALGQIPPAAGALLQEAIDVAVILNALRAARPERVPTPRTAAQARPEGWEMVSLPRGTT